MIRQFVSPRVRPRGRAQGGGLRRGLAVGLVLAVWGGGCVREPKASYPDPLVIFAAASLTDVLHEIGAAYTEGGGDSRPKVVFHVAGSSMLARQILLGAPADGLISAHPEWIDTLEAAGRLFETRTLPVGNRIVVIRRVGSGAGQTDAWWRSRRVALADPSHVPAGRYAREALSCMGLWPDIRVVAVPTLDVRAAVAAVESGAASVGLVYASDVYRNPRVEPVAVVPDSCQPRIRYRAGVKMQGDGARALDFLDFATDSARARYWRAAGFEFNPPGVAITTPSSHR